MIKDSGDRTQFDTGAVRDMREGKGRCDLLPLDVAAYSLFEDEADAYSNPLFALSDFQDTGETIYLSKALEYFVAEYDDWNHLFSTMLLEVAKHFEEGAQKYGENNWQNGIPVWCYIDSAVRHYLKLRRGDKDEPHDRAFCWNVMCAWWTCLHKPELNGYLEGKDG